jgi:SNF2 family DNA or RNA helicase
MKISRQAVREFVRRPFDDFNWMKALPRDKILAELRQLKVRPVFKTQPWEHQLVCFYIGMFYPRFLFLLDMGLGKSKILADLITQAMREKRIKHALISVPRLINIDSWTDDLDRHSDLEPWGIGIPDIEEKRDRLLNPKGEVTLIDYQGLQWALCRKERISGKKTVLVRDDKLVRRARQLYGFIGIDESHKLSNTESLWYGIMKQLSKNAEMVFATTGTLFGSQVEDLWGQFQLVDQGETFGETLGLFRAALFKEETQAWSGYPKYVFDKANDKLLHKMLQHRSIRYDETEVLDLPKRVYRTQMCEMGEEQRNHYLRALEGLINAGGQLSELDSQWLRMRQIISGYLAWADESGKHVIRFKQNPKLDHLERLMAEMGDSKIVICYDYTETGSMIVDRVKAMGLGYEWFYGGTKDKSASRTRFMTDPSCKVFVMNSEAGGTGNDGLQKVARYMVFYETPTPPNVRKQTEKRIHRPGQDKRVFIWDLVMARSLDRGILDGIAEGIDIHARVVNGKADNKNLFLR